MPALTRFIDGTGPVFAGPGLPLLLHHDRLRRDLGLPFAIVASGTTPKLLARRGRHPDVGYGAMMTEMCVGVMALIAACSMAAGRVFRDQHEGRRGRRDRADLGARVPGHAARTWRRSRASVGEKTMIGRAGGAPTFARRHGADVCRGPPQQGGARPLVPLCDHVRGAVHPDDDRRRHPRRALPRPGPPGARMEAPRATPLPRRQSRGDGALCRRRGAGSSTRGSSIPWAGSTRSGRSSASRTSCSR